MRCTYHADIQKDTGEKMHVTYFVIPAEKQEDLPSACFGLGISDGQSTHIVKAFSPSKEETVKAARMLCRCTVTPATFWDVLDTYLAEN